MGCDIHLHTELKINGQWQHYSAPSISRDYHLFGRLSMPRYHDVTVPEGIQDARAVFWFDC